MLPKDLNEDFVFQLVTKITRIWIYILLDLTSGKFQIRSEERPLLIQDCVALANFSAVMLEEVEDTSKTEASDLEKEMIEVLEETFSKLPKMFSIGKDSQTLRKLKAIKKMSRSLVLGTGEEYIPTERLRPKTKGLCESCCDVTRNSLF